MEIRVVGSGTSTFFVKDGFDISKHLKGGTNMWANQQQQHILSQKMSSINKY